ncbi:MAG: hypothetical protein Ct9H90mP6_04370 [Gammaproteobacteria bacterium]|nr:MAG: hypothetical protein Ct9H90mP6_04370 [Gammaproteobacteria bacterium]
MFLKYLIHQNLGKVAGCVVVEGTVFKEKTGGVLRDDIEIFPKG